MSHHASTDDDNTRAINQTILWAREALQRRRRDLQEQKNNLVICSNGDDESVLGLSQSLPSPSRALSSTEVYSALKRGRALLAAADAQAEILRKYASISKIEMHPKLDGTKKIALNSQMAKHWTDGKCNNCTTVEDSICSLHCTYSERSPVGSNTGAPVDLPHLEDEESNLMIPEDIDGDDEDREELIRKRNVRESLDGLITNIGHQDEFYIITPEKKVSHFDPSNMNSAKRAIIKKIKLDNAVATAEEQARLLTSFRALPLPGGVEVTNNLYATTQSFEGKHIGSVENLVRRRRDTAQNDKLHDESSSIFSGKVCTRDDFSSVRSMNSCDNSFMQSEFENDADRQRTRELIAEKKMKKRQLLNSVNKIVSGNMLSFAQEDNVSSKLTEGDDFVEDPSKLRQDVARLEAKLKQKQTQRDATLNDIVDIDLNAIFDTFLPRETSDDARQIIDQLKRRAFDCVTDFHNITPNTDKSAREVLMDNVPQRMSVVQRQEEWSKRREQKLFNARMQLEADTMDGVTGMPEISQTSQSWKRAKESHDKTLEIIAEAEEKKNLEKIAKEKALSEMKEEKERQQQQDQSKPTVVKCEVNKEEQMKRLEMLSRPRHTIEATIHVESSIDAATTMQRPDHWPTSKILDSVKQTKEKSKSTREKKVKQKSESNLKSLHRYNPEMNSNENPTAELFSDKKPDEFCGFPSFSDMSDKDFAKLVKRISRNALKVKESTK